jgi:hypothetical protein
MLERAHIPCTYTHPCRTRFEYLYVTYPNKIRKQQGNTGREQQGVCRQSIISFRFMLVSSNLKISAKHTIMINYASWTTSRDEILFYSLNWCSILFYSAMLRPFLSRMIWFLYQGLLDALSCTGINFGQPYSIRDTHEQIRSKRYPHYRAGTTLERE